MGQSQGVRVVAGSQVLFTQTAMILLGLQQPGNRRPDGVECRILSDTAEALHEADGWRRFATLGHGVGEDAKETYTLLARVAGPVGKCGEDWAGFWEKVHAVEGTLKTLSGGGTPTPQQLATAMEFCTKASNQGPITAGLRRVK